MRRRSDSAAILLVMAFSAMGLSTAAAGPPAEPKSILHVPADHPTIQDAIDAAEGGDLVLVAPGTYAEPVNFLGKAIEVRSSDGAEQTILDGAALNGSIVLMLDDEPNDAVLSGFTLRAGAGTFFGLDRLGGAIFAVGAEATVSDCVFEGNSATGAGGAIAMIGCQMRIERCRFRHNEAGFGDGGGAIWMSGSGGRIQRCRFVGNSAGFFGGALSLVNSSPFIVNSLFIGNEAAQGGAIRNSSSSPTVVHCTVAFNTAGDDFITTGGGMRSSLAPCDPVVRGSIFWGNEPSEIIDLAGAATDVSCCLVEGWSSAGGCGADSTDPGFIDPIGADGTPGTGDENMRLAASSPGVDQGSDGDVPAWASKDLDGNERFVDAPPSGSGLVDLGPFERQSETLGDLDGDGDVNAQDLFYLLSGWGPCPGGPPCSADLTGDETVDAQDLFVLLSQWSA